MLVHSHSGADVSDDVSYLRVSVNKSFLRVYLKKDLFLFKCLSWHACSAHMVHAKFLPDVCSYARVFLDYSLLTIDL